MNRRFSLLNFLLFLSLALSSCHKQESAFIVYGDLGGFVAQSKIERIAGMPDIPKPYKMLDWRQKALDYDAYVFNEHLQLLGKPLIWYDNSGRNFPQETFGLYTTVGDCRQGPGVNVQNHESLNSLSALLGASLCGIDKTAQNGRNYVKMVQNYFHKYGYGVMMNNTSGGGNDWWYVIFPNILYYALCDLYPEVDGAETIQRSIADKFCQADEVLAGNYDYSSFNYQTMNGIRNQIPYQQDAAGGHAWVLYSAYKKFGDQRYLDHAVSAMDALHAQRESRFYEVLLPMGILTAAQMNAELGKNYDLKKMINWVFDGCKSHEGRYGWGVISDHWGPYDVHGLQGSTTDGGGYAFFMNSIKLAMPLVPMVKYAPRYANSIGKWMLNMANNCRLFYPDQIDDYHQWLPEKKMLTQGNVAYEGLRRVDKYGKKELKGVVPVALGDGPSWTSKNPDVTMFSLYSTSPVGILGALVEKTDVDAILRIDCNVTDFYEKCPYPVFLYYNPYLEEKQVSYIAKGEHVYILDILSKTFKANDVVGSCSINIPPKSSVLLTELPAGIEIICENGMLVNKNNGKIISYL